VIFVKTILNEPRKDYPNEEGALGIGLVATEIIKQPFFKAIGQGLWLTLNLIWMIILAFGGILKSLFTEAKVSADVSGPLGIAYIIKQVSELGFVYILQTAALISINLGIINIVPFPALDGGRIIFILLEKIKGSPVSQKIEQTFHAAGFFLLIFLMIAVTFRDFMRFEIWEKFKSLWG
jgi:regulator of sigma E protease